MSLHHPPHSSLRPLPSTTHADPCAPTHADPQPTENGNKNNLRERYYPPNLDGTTEARQTLAATGEVQTIGVLLGSAALGEQPVRGAAMAFGYSRQRLPPRLRSEGMVVLGGTKLPTIYYGEL